MNTNPLGLPPGADQIFDQCRSFPRGGTKLLIYGLAGVVKDEDVENLCNEATASYQANEADEEYEGQTFMKPPPKDRRFPGETVQEILDAHVDFTSGRANRAAEGDDIFPFAFVVIEQPEWRTHGVTIVFCDDKLESYCDEDGSARGWRVAECETAVAALGGFCQELVMEEDDWHSLTVHLGRPTARNGPPMFRDGGPRAWSPKRISFPDVAGSW